ncbi:hypothetical protein THRCLA_20659 [Thraustotheca clavata]|uniref:Uncharacterized protein n=1 Tax=Thraustotheca clavata TaxID=74557 RepID=A0A1W0A4U8_9STRA|nr:hypothetical protein THRCLA_20659 [Thraustotheca clavata]
MQTLLTVGNSYHTCFDGYSQVQTKIIPYILAAPMESMWLDEFNDEFNDVSEYPMSLAKAAIVGGHVQLLKYLVTVKGIKLNRFREIEFFDNIPIEIAAENGHLEIVKYLHSAGNENRMHLAISRAATKDHLHIIKWLHENTRGDTTMMRQEMQLKMYFHENRTKGCTRNAMDGAAEMFLHENRAEGCTTRAIDKAAKNGCTYEAINDAADGGHLDVVKFLHENRVERSTNLYIHENRSEPFPSRALGLAASSGYFEVAKYLIETITSQIIKNALNNSHTEIVEFFWEYKLQAKRKRKFCSMNESDSYTSDE